MVRGYGLLGTIRMAWKLNDEDLIRWEGQWLANTHVDSYGNVLHRMKWIPKDLDLYLNYIWKGSYNAVRYQ